MPALQQQPFSSSRSSRSHRGMTMIELLIALFIFLVGIVGLMAAMPTGVSTAGRVIFQDAAIHLSRSKFAEFRRDRIDARYDLVDGSLYMDPVSPPRRQEPQNGNPGGWRDFAHAPGDTYENFDEIERYQWRIDQPSLVSVGTDVGAGNVPKVSGGTDVGLTRVILVIALKGTTREYRFDQYMYAYGN
jgi:prepilin-type N-terminal cleavage/methylation domain-containing protein